VPNHRVVDFRIEPHVETRAELDCSEDPDRVFSKTDVGIPNRAKQVLFEVGHTTDEIDHFAALEVVEQAVDREVATREVVFEREYGYLGGDDAVADRIQGRPGRRAGSWFSYVVPVDGSAALSLILTCFSGDRRGLPASFVVLIDGTRVADLSIARSEPPRFFDVEASIPAALVRGRREVTLRFEATAGGRIPTIFGVRLIRADAER